MRCGRGCSRNRAKTGLGYKYGSVDCLSTQCSGCWRLGGCSGGSENAPDTFRDGVAHAFVGLSD